MPQVKLSWGFSLPRPKVWSLFQVQLSGEVKDPSIQSSLLLSNGERCCSWTPCSGKHFREVQAPTHKAEYAYVGRAGHPDLINLSDDFVSIKDFKENLNNTTEGCD